MNVLKVPFCRREECKERAFTSQVRKRLGGKEVSDKIDNKSTLLWDENTFKIRLRVLIHIGKLREIRWETFHT